MNEFRIYYYVWPWNGVLPSIISYRRIPNDQKSTFLVKFNLSKIYGAKYYKVRQILTRGALLKDTPK